MKTVEYLLDPDLAPLYRPGFLAGVAIAIASGPLSVLVVLKRLAFIGQGISHAAFGGIGVAAALGLTAAVTATGIRDAPAGGLWQFLVVFLFCLGAALGVGALSDRDTTREDTAIGIVLVASMALGAVLLYLARTGIAWESFLFGSIFNISPVDAAVAGAVSLGVIVAMWASRRRMVFWAFDDSGAEAFGVRPAATRALLLALLAVATVATMKLAGVVLATAMLVLPGAAALHLSRRLYPVVAISLIIALVSVVAGIVLSFELDLPPGPAIVLVLTAAFAAARISTPLRHRMGVGTA